MGLSRPPMPSLLRRHNATEPLHWIAVDGLPGVPKNFHPVRAMGGGAGGDGSTEHKA
jgi:hypothetical protein